MAGKRGRFILSPKSLDAYYALRDSLVVSPSESAHYSSEQREAMWAAKNRFRARLREDVQLLFTEDREFKRKPRDPLLILKQQAGELSGETGPVVPEASSDAPNKML